MDREKKQHSETVGLVLGLLFILGLVCLALGEYVILLLLWGAGAILLARARRLGVEPKDDQPSAR